MPKADEVGAGGLVLQARSVYNYIINDIADYFDDCEYVLRRGILNSISSFNQSAFKLYPNPNNGSMQLYYTISEADFGVVNIYTVLGEKVANYTLNSISNSLKIELNHLANGIYFYEVLVNNKKVNANKISINK